MATTGDARPSGSAGWVARDAAVVWHGFTQMAAYADNAPIVVDHAEGRELVDVDGRRYLDAISSLWVTTLGHRVPELDDALVEQLGRVAHTTMLGHGNAITIELAEALAGRLPVDGAHVLFASDGAVGVEQAIKIAFQHWRNRGASGRDRFLSVTGAYHGDTVGSISIGDDGFGVDLFDPLRFGVQRGPWPDSPEAADALCATVLEAGEGLAAVVTEVLVQGASGMRMAPPESFARLADACARTGALLVVDEVATGFGRTGTLFACEAAGVRPDLLCIGKGLTGGYLPMSATVVADHVYRSFLGEDLGPRTLYHGHSYGGNALAAAVALRHLGLLDEWDVLTNVTARSAQLEAALHAAFDASPAVADIRVRGLMGAVELAPPRPGLRWGRRVTAGCVGRGVLLRPLGDVVPIVPPLTTTAAEIDRIVDALAASVAELEA